MTGECKFKRKDGLGMQISANYYYQDLGLDLQCRCQFHPIQTAHFQKLTISAAVHSWQTRQSYTYMNYE